MDYWMYTKLFSQCKVPLIQIIQTINTAKSRQQRNSIYFGSLLHNYLNLTALQVAQSSKWYSSSIAKEELMQENLKQCRNKTYLQK